MIKGERKIELSMEVILQKISEFDIFRYYFGDFKINTLTYNHLRGEKQSSTPSFIIGNKGSGNTLHFYDFGDVNWRGDCFDLIMKIYNCSLYDALLKIDADFGLGIQSTPIGDYRKITNTYKQPESLGKRYSLIQVKTRKFTAEELAYWKKYYLTIDDLRENKIYSIKELYLNKKKFSLKDDELRFGYFYEGGWWKIYFCEAEKKRKWISNVPLTTMYGLENLDKDHNALVVKSLKDYMVCRKLYKYVCQVQNESLAAFSPENVEYIKANSKEVFYGGDSDTAGKSASYAITAAFGFKHINPPDRLLPCCKDFADWAREENLEVVKNHFIKKGIYE